MPSLVQVDSAQRTKAQPIPKELAMLGVGQGLAGPQRHTRAAAAADVRQTRSAAAGPTPAKPAPVAKPVSTSAAKPAAKPPASAAKAKGKPAGKRASVASPGKGASLKPAGTAGRAGRRLHLTEAEADGETFHVGDAVYIVLDTAALEGLR